MKFRVFADYRAIFGKQNIHDNLSFDPLKYCHNGHNDHKTSTFRVIGI